MADALGATEPEVIGALRRLSEMGAVSRVGPVFSPNRIGASTLAAMAVPRPRLDEVASLVSGYAEVNHNYEREHHYNLWFVVTAPDKEAMHTVIDDIERRAGIEALRLPMLENYHIDLGFDIGWTDEAAHNEPASERDDERV